MLVKNVKKSFVNQSDENPLYQSDQQDFPPVTISKHIRNSCNENDNSYHYKKKRGSSLQRFQEQEQQSIEDHEFQRRSFTNNLKEPFSGQRHSKVDPKPNLIMNTILKENIKRYPSSTDSFSKKNNNEMPLQKLRMKQKVSYLKSNFTKTNEEIKANLKKKINNYQDILKKNFCKNKVVDIENIDQIRDNVHYRGSSSKYLPFKHSDNRNDTHSSRDHSSTKEIPPKYSSSSSSSALSSSFMKKVEVDQRNRFGNLKNVIYDRIGSKSPANRKRNIEPSAHAKKNFKFNNIPRHTPKVFEVDRPKKEKEFKKRLGQKNDYYDGRRTITNDSSSSDSSLSGDYQKRGNNIRRTIANHQRSLDSSLSSSPSYEFS